MAKTADRAALRRLVYAFPPTRRLLMERARWLQARAVKQMRPEQMMEQPSLHAFWRQDAPEGNAPQDYFEPQVRSRVLAELIGELPTDRRILEIGCNVGRNLAHLADLGYRHLEGVEISPHAVELLRENYPQLADSPVHLGAAEDVLPRLAGPYDLVFTMAVLEHIHPDSRVVFEQIARLGSAVLAIEPAPAMRQSTDRQFPHDMPVLFGAFGLTHVSTTELTNHPLLLEDDKRRQEADPEHRFVLEDMHRYAAYRFERG